MCGKNTKFCVHTKLQSAKHHTTLISLTGLSNLTEIGLMVEAFTEEQKHNSASHLSMLTEPGQHTSVNPSLWWMGSLCKHTDRALRFPSSGSQRARPLLTRTD